MKVLRVIATMNPRSGGPCQGIRNSIPVQTTYGVESEVVCFDNPEADYLRKDQFKIHAIGPAKGPYSYCPKLVPWLKSNMNRFDIVIIHGLWLHNSYGTYSLWQLQKSKKIRVPRLYVMPHGMLDPYFQKAKSRRFKAIRNHLFWKLVENRVVNGVDGLLFTCEQERLLAGETFRPYCPKSEYNVSYGVELPPPQQKKFLFEFLKFCPEVTDRPYWLFLGRIHPKKGVDLLLQAYATLKKKQPNIPDLVLAGPGLETSFGKKLQENAQTVPGVFFPGMLTGEAKWGAFYGCEVFLLPSHQENFGIAVVEALACGRPVLISDQVNIWREIITGNGGLVSEDTEEGIYNSLVNWFYETEEKKMEMGRKALDIYQKRYTIEEAAHNMIDQISTGMEKNVDIRDRYGLRNSRHKGTTVLKL